MACNIQSAIFTVHSKEKVREVVGNILSSQTHQENIETIGRFLAFVNLNNHGKRTSKKIITALSVVTEYTVKNQKQ